MISDYISFNAVKYLKDYYYFKGVLPSLKAKYEALDGARAVAYGGDKVQTSPTPDELEKIALERVLLSKKIDEYQEHIDSVDSAVATLDDDEKKAVDLFFNPACRDDFATYGWGRTMAYVFRSEALSKISVIVTGTDNFKK